MTYPCIEHRSELRFPHMAEEALNAFKNSKVTISLAGICLYNGAQRSYEKDEYGRTVTVYHMEDDTSVCTRGRGKSYTAWIELP